MISFSIPHGNVIHVAGRAAEALSGELTVSFHSGRPETPFAFGITTGINQVTEVHISALQAVRLLRFLKTELERALKTRHKTDKSDQEPPAESG